jgi:hemerythrin-like domain-containing protein
MKTRRPSTACSSHDAVTRRPTDILRREHELIGEVLRLVERLGQRLERGARIDGTVRERLVQFLTAFVDGCHHAKEERELFPALERAGVPRDNGPIGIMLADHESARALIPLMAGEDPRPAGAAMSRYAALMRVHIEKENGILFRLADMVLPDAAQQALADAFAVLDREASATGPEALLAELSRLGTSTLGHAAL